MVAEDSQPPLNYSADYHVNTNININPNKHRSYEDNEEEEETLSLCDLPIYSDSFKWDDDFSTRDHSSNSFETVDDEDDFFEFFSDEYLTTASTNPNSVHKTDMIVFCGKLIPYKGTIAGQHQQQQQQQYDVVAAPPAKQSDVAAAKRQQGVLGHYVKPSNDSEAVSSSSSSRGFRVGMVKPRWYVYLFGMVRFPPAEMALRDMRTRQGRRRRSGSGSGRGEMKGETTKKKASSKSGRRGGLKGLWGLFRALGCRSRHVENVAKAAYGAVPRVSGA